MKLTDGLFLDTFRRISQEYPEIKCEEMIVDNAAMQLVSKPTQFDVIVTPNLYGAILTNVAAALAGSPGLLSGYNLGSGFALYEAGARHMAQNGSVDNPVGLLRSALLMLRHLELIEHADLIEKALENTMSADVRTLDLGGKHDSSSFVDEVIARL